MPEITLTVNHKVGLHARPASLFVQTSAKFSSDIEISHGNATVNAKSILAVLTLGVHQGTEITITANGDDAAEALDSLADLVKNNFGEGS
jgi:phosphotransferase system HPr (HPr) family protein